jgi:coenzyme PQQ synthesis protein D (PqqD)
MRYRLNDNDVVSEVLDGEVIVIHLQSGTYYSMLASGADIWNALLSDHSVEEITDWLGRGAEEERGHIATEVARFVSELVAEKLILSTDSDQNRRPDDLGTAPAFVTPELHIYTDMQELLLVDPIHEVTEEGWPLRDTTKK